MIDVVTRRVLFVDDDPETREVMHRNLTQAGYDVSTASSAEEAMQVFSGGGEVHAVIADVHLKGMDGKTLVNRILARRPETKAVLVTAYGSVTEYLEATRTGAVEYLLKPIDPSYLLRLLDQSIGRPAEMPSEYWLD